MAVESDKVSVGKTVGLSGLLSPVTLAQCERREEKGEAIPQPAPTFLSSRLSQDFKTRCLGRLAV